MREEENALVRAWFLRLLGLVYGIAILSLWVQIQGLIGSDGILPVASYLERAAEVLGGDAWSTLPTLLWFAAGDLALHALCAAGVGLALALMVGCATAAAAAGLWLIYLSLLTAGQAFLSFQWDILLLETGFLAILWSPPDLRPRWIWRRRPTVAITWLLRWLQFRLIFSSGFVKLASGDPTWRELRALDVHYETQPLPSWTSWYAHQLPGELHSASVLVLFLIELAVPFAIFAGRRPRLWAAALLAFLQLGIAATGNYGFFNLLALVLCLPLLDDRCLHRLWEVVRRTRTMGSRPWCPPDRWPRWIMWPAAALLLTLSCYQFGGTLRLSVPWPDFVHSMHKTLRPFHLSSGYGLFAVMTTERPEIVVEGSLDGVTWVAYEFKWKPGAVLDPPRFAAPHMPRLDWQMWFAALRAPPQRQPPWFRPFLVRLLQCSPAVTALLHAQPFATPPRFVRAQLLDYRFTNANERAESGRWWNRRPLRPYSQTLSLRRP